MNQEPEIPQGWQKNGRLLYTAEQHATTSSLYPGWHNRMMVSVTHNHGDGAEQEANELTARLLDFLRAPDVGARGLHDEVERLMAALPTEYPPMWSSGEYFTREGVQEALRKLVQTNARLVDETYRWSDAVKKLEAERTTKQAWISVDERLPEEGQKVLLIYNEEAGPFYSGCTETGAIVMHESGSYHWSAHEAVDREWVDFWLPIPEHPTPAKKNLSLTNSRWVYVAETPELKEQVNALFATIGLAIPEDNRGPRYKYVLWNSDKVDALYSNWTGPRWGMTQVSYKELETMVNAYQPPLPTT